MGKETEKILELLQYWQEYTEQHAAEFASFGEWLINRTEDKPAQLQNSQGTSFRDQYIHEEVSVEDRIVLHWGRLQRFTHLWSKKALKNLPISSMEEFGLIKTVELLKSARKSDLVKYTLTETTTCFEMIKRLVKAGFLQEEVAPEDRRSKKVSLTNKGKKLSRHSDQQVRLLSRLLIGNITQAQKLALLDVLKELDDFHARLYAQGVDATLTELLDMK